MQRSMQHNKAIGTNEDSSIGGVEDFHRLVWNESFPGNKLHSFAVGSQHGAENTKIVTKTDAVVRVPGYLQPRSQGTACSRSYSYHKARIACLTE